MDIAAEINQIKTQEATSRDLLFKLENEKKILDRKMHLIKVFAFVTEIDDMIKTGLFQEFNIDEIKLTYQYNDDVDAENLYYELLSDGVKVVSYDSHGNRIEPINRMEQAISKISWIKHYYLNNDFKEKSSVIIGLDENATSKIYDLLLTPKLRTALEFSLLQVDLSNDNQDRNKKVKI